MSIKSISSTISNFVIAQNSNIKNFLGKGVVLIKHNPIAVVASIICLAALSIGAKCYNSVNFFRKDLSVQTIPMKVEVLTPNEVPKQMLLASEENIAQIKDVEEQLLDIFPKELPDFSNLVFGYEDIFPKELPDFSNLLFGETEIENEFPPADLPPELPLSVKLKDLYESQVGVTYDDLDESWADSDTPPTDLPPQLPLDIKLRDLYESFKGEKSVGLDLEWDTISSR